jgi:hypothetical protein
MKFIKKPVVVEAYQITEELLKPILFDGGEYPEGLRISFAFTYPPDRSIISWDGSVTNIHGQNTAVEIGDWIITEPDKTHHYPCKPDIFEMTYEAVE